jgi:mannose-6-phosphate isomerase-like protein (cupin superfamily)
MADSISLADKLATFQDYWSPRTVTTFNDCDVMVVKVKGEFTWHKHDNEDEMFLVVYGRLVLQFEEGEVALDAGDFYVVRKGKLHNPVADQECGLALIETMTTLHTGDVKTRLSKSIAEQLAG